MTPHDINRTLAEKVMGWHEHNGWWCFELLGAREPTPHAIAFRVLPRGLPSTFDPYGNSNHLREVLAKLTDDQWDHLLVGLVLHQDAPKSDKPFWQWMLTCDPSIIAQAVAEVVRPDTPAATAPSLDRAPQS